MELYYTICVALFGLLFGSFLNCTAMRIVRGEDFVKGRSHCMSCDHQLAAIDLIPVLSYAMTGGRCRYCKEKISIRYPVTEILFMVLSVVLYKFTGHDLLLFYKNWVLTGCLFAIAITDIENYEIPNLLIITALISWCGFSVVEFITKRHDLLYFGKRALTAFVFGAAMLILSMIMDRILKKDSLGGGDIKLYSLLGLYLGAAGAYELLILSCIFGIVFALIRKKIKPDSSKEFPLGPSIAAAAYIVLIFGENITTWYLNFL